MPFSFHRDEMNGLRYNSTCKMPLVALLKALPGRRLFEERIQAPDETRGAQGHSLGSFESGDLRRSSPAKLVGAGALCLARHLARFPHAYSDRA